jgi:DNA-binding PadR family transcriptional regulator
LKFHIGSVYPILLRMEKRGWIRGDWREEQGARRKRIYCMTPAGRAVLQDQRSLWRELVRAIERVASHA